MSCGERMSAATTTKSLIGGIEGGGTKFNCAIGYSPQEVLASTSFSTGTPAETLAQAIAFFEVKQLAFGPLRALGMASFGPIDVDPASAHYGFITTPPKPGWAYTDVVGTLTRALRVPVTFDTDVNGATLAEGAFGAGRECRNFAYVTIGTGIGAGVVMDGCLLRGAANLEIGHMRVPRFGEASSFRGCCPYHGDCLEGLAAGPALEARWGQKGQQLPADHPAWELQAHYLATMCVNLTLCYAPQRIILGGGVMFQGQLFALIRQTFTRLLNGYVTLPADSLDDYIVPPALHGHSGEVGALLAAEQWLVHNSTDLKEISRV